MEIDSNTAHIETTNCKIHYDASYNVKLGGHAQLITSLQNLFQLWYENICFK